MSIIQKVKASVGRILYGTKEYRSSDAFRFSPSGFQMWQKYEPAPGLAQRIEELVGDTRFRTALSELLDMLADNPRNQEALELATITLNAATRTSQLQSKEPITQSQYLDRRLDPIFVFCNDCRKAFWVPNCMMGQYESINVWNPAGLQCTECGYVVCRQCFERHRVVIDFANISTKCPNCGKEALAPPLIPTGRPPLQLARSACVVSAIVILREGPIRPEPSYVEELLKKISPDAFEGHPLITAVPAGAWPSDPDSLAMAILAKRVNDGDASWNSSIPTETANLSDENGLRVCVVKAFGYSMSARSDRDEIVATKTSRSASEAVLGRISSLRATAINEQSEAERFLWNLLLSHLERVGRTQKLGAAAWEELLDPIALQVTCKMMDRLIRSAAISAQHECQSWDGPRVYLLASAVPTAESSEARGYFKDGYMGFLDHKQMTNIASKKSFVHWIACRDDRTVVVHLTCFPLDKKGCLLATDLMSPTELHSTISQGERGAQSTSLIPSPRAVSRNTSP